MADLKTVLLALFDQLNAYEKRLDLTSPSLTIQVRGVTEFDSERNIIAVQAMIDGEGRVLLPRTDIRAVEVADTIEFDGTARPYLIGIASLLQDGLIDVDEDIFDIEISGRSRDVEIVGDNAEALKGELFEATVKLLDEVQPVRVLFRREGNDLRFSPALKEA